MRNHQIEQRKRVKMFDVESTKAEAVKRMNDLGMTTFVIDQFKKGVVMKSVSDFLGFSIPGRENKQEWPYWRLTNFEQKKLKEVEEKRNCLVYHVVESSRFTGHITFLCVEPREDGQDWEFDAVRLQNGVTTAYVVNTLIPEYSEAGSVIIRNDHNTIVRIG